MWHQIWYRVHTYDIICDVKCLGLQLFPNQDMAMQLDTISWIWTTTNMFLLMQNVHLTKNSCILDCTESGEGTARTSGRLSRQWGSPTWAQLVKWFCWSKVGLHVSGFIAVKLWVLFYLASFCNEGLYSILLWAGFFNLPFSWFQVQFFCFLGSAKCKDHLSRGKIQFWIDWACSHVLIPTHFWVIDS